MLTTAAKGVVKPEQLRLVAQIVEDNLAKDNFPDLQELLQNDVQKRSQVTMNMEISQWNFLQLESFKTLPDFMLQQYDSLQVSSFMGIFPEINRVWMTIDNHLYLWNYDAPDSSELINTYEDPDQVIVNVSLVKPIKGVFLEQIEYLLVVSTPLEITLLGVAFAEPRKGSLSRGSLTIYRTDMACYADGVNMSSIVATPKGRIFMRGNDGQLFELVYQAQDGWLTRKIRKLNKSASSIAVFIPSIFNWAGSDPIRMIVLDNDRNLLYSVSKKNSIELISLGQSGEEFNRIARISDLADQLLRYSAFDDHITSIHPTAYSESKVIQCVAITSSGHRLYFSTHNSSGFGQYSLQTNYVAPNTLQLRYVLAPPAISGTLPQQGSKVHESYYFNGLTVAAQAMDDLDRVLVFAPHPGAILQSTIRTMSEYASFFDVEGRTWAIAEAPNEQFRFMRQDGNDTGIHLNELASQYEYESRKLYLLTNGGLTTISKLRPLDLLLRLINTKSSGDTRAFQEFVSSFGVDQTCAMCLAIACSHPSISSGQFGIPQNICNIASKMYFDFGGSPSMNAAQPVPGMAPTGAMGVPLSTKELAFSPKHNGLALYITRILRPIWKKEIVIQKYW
jgi:nuclear pore complex protein Nup155